MLIVVPTYGFGNITNNVVALGPASIPSWIIVSVFFFLPLSLFIPELAGADEKSSSGIYAWIKAGLGENWAFIGTWSYFVSTLFYLQMVFARIPVMASYMIFGENRFSDSNTWLLPLLSAVLCVLLTWIASTGVGKFSKISDIGGKVTLAFTLIFIIFAFVGIAVGKPSATTFTAQNLTPTFDTTYFSTFSWLLLAVAGAEVGGTYIKDMENPKRDFAKSVFIATAFIAGAYIIGSIAVLLVASPEAIQNAGLKEAIYYVYGALAESFGINGQIVVRIYALCNMIASIAAYIVWMDSPLRALFSEVPEGTFPRVLTKQEPDGTMKNALWIQCAVVVVLILVPLLGLGGIDALFTLLQDLSALSSVPAYAMLALAYFVFRKKGCKSTYTAFKSNGLALTMAAIAVFLGILACIGAGFDYFMWAETTAEAVKLFIKTYGGPVILIIVGWFLRKWSMKAYSKKNK